MIMMLGGADSLASACPVKRPAEKKNKLRKNVRVSLMGMGKRFLR
jgi:hypothetical protein